MKQILLDTPNICYASHFKLKSLRARTEEGSIHTGAIYGLLRAVISLAQEFRSNEFYFCFEGGGSKRKKIYPDYKGNRDKESEDTPIVMEQLRLLDEEILPDLGFSMTCSQAGYEADDIIAQLSHQLKYDVVIVSGDEDLYQLLTPGVSQYLPKKKKLYTYEDFKKDYGIEPEDWPSYKAIAGDSSDNIPGIKGLGPKKTLKMLKLENWLNVDLMPNERELYKKFLRLTKLPFPGTPYQELWEDELDFSRFAAVCERFSFDSLILHDSDNWERIISGDFSTAKDRVSQSLNRGRRRGLFNAEN